MVSAENKQNNQAETSLVEETTEGTERASVLKFTEEQAQEIYNEGQKSGYIAAIKQIRTSITDYLNDLIVSAGMNKDGSTR